MACPRCPLPQYPCFANLDGRCIILSDTTFTKRPCPFRKTKWEAEAQMKKIAEKETKGS